jgi:hypothetical protein
MNDALAGRFVDLRNRRRECFERRLFVLRADFRAQALHERTNGARHFAVAGGAGDALTIALFCGRMIGHDVSLIEEILQSSRGRGCEGRETYTSMPSCQGGPESRFAHKLASWTVGEQKARFAKREVKPSDLRTGAKIALNLPVK